MYTLPADFESSFSQKLISTSPYHIYFKYFMSYIVNKSTFFIILFVLLDVVNLQKGSDQLVNQRSFLVFDLETSH